MKKPVNVLHVMKAGMDVIVINVYLVTLVMIVAHVTVLTVLVKMALKTAENVNVMLVGKVKPVTLKVNVSKALQV